MLREQTQTKKKINLFQRPIAVPNEHGSWVFLFSPLLIGLFLGKTWTPTTGIFILAVLAGFMARQPITIAVKVLSKRRPRRELPVAMFWIGVYGGIGLLCLGTLLLQGYSYLLWLLLPALPVLAWHLWLVSRRAERRKVIVEVVGSGVLALAAPAAYWMGSGQADALGWLLWGLVWLQASGSILYAYLRLAQRPLESTPDTATRWRMAAPALAFNSANLAIAAVLAALNWVPALLPLSFGVQWLETLWGSTHPAVGIRPTAIGVRQLIVSSLFTLVFILAYWVA